MSKRRPGSASSLDALFEVAAEAMEVTRATAGRDGTEKPLSLPIRSIRPDPFQARRVLPAAVRAGFVTGQLDAPGALAAWRALGEDEGREAELLQSQVVNLAASIREQELVNPITVSVDGPSRYLIETGERRWWAHWWLVSVEKRPAYEQIQAQIVAAASPERQAAENLQDSPLTAVQEACQIARLLLHQTGRDADHVVAMLARGRGGDREGLLVGYAPYRVALDLQRKDVYGKWATIAQVMGRGERQLQRQLALLKLADGALELADRAGLTEGQLRALVEAAEGTDGERQRRIIGLAAEYALSGPEVARLVKTANLEAAEARLARQRQQKTTGEEASAAPTAIRRPAFIMLERLRKLRRFVARQEKGGLEMGDLADEVLGADQPDVIYHELLELTEMLLWLRAEVESRQAGRSG
jgi:ParB-like chromosome segregation protein Spo0J